VGVVSDEADCAWTGAGIESCLVVGVVWAGADMLSCACRVTSDGELPRGGSWSLSSKGVAALPRKGSCKRSGAWRFRWFNDEEEESQKLSK